MNKWKERLQRFMTGRYGVDGLGRFLVNLSLVAIVAGFLIREPWPQFLAMICLVLSYFRMLSRNYGKRSAENRKYEALRYEFLEKFRKLMFKMKEKKEYHIYKCPSCGQKIRVPRGKGKISVHCPKCHTDFIKKS